MATMEMTTAPAPPHAAAAQTIFQLSTAYMASAALHVATRLNIADQLASGPASIETLARNAGVKRDPLYRVMRALSAVGVFEERPGRVFASNPAADLLRSGPGLLRDLAMFLTDTLHFNVYADMLYSVSSGRPAVEYVTGLPVFELFARDREVADSFNAAMTTMSALIAPAVLEAYDFSGIGVLADIAGGHGYIIGSILTKYPEMRGILFELEGVLEGAPRKLQEMGVADRCQLIAGDFFGAVPAGADAYLMQHIIHDWDDDDAVTILQNVRAALARHADGRLLLLESVISDEPEANLAKVGDLEMMVLPGGRERTAGEFEALLTRAGFVLTRIVRTATLICVIEARVR